jgi:two-component sensor histidine kinase
MNYQMVIIDDNPDDLYIIRRLLSRLPDHFEIISYENPLQALEYCSSHNPDCILIDYHLIDMTGIEFTAQYRHHQEQAAPVILLTGQGDEAIAVQALKSGVSDYLMKKNLSAEILLKSIQYVIEKNKNEAAEKENNRMIAKSLKEKEFLIREIYHRIKNQMATLLAMVRFSNQSSPDQIIQNIELRINAYLELYDTLCYSSQKDLKIRLSSYLKRITGYIAGTYDRDEVKNIVTGEDFFLNNSDAVTIGLIINELCTNSYKYAFKDKEPGTIETEIRRGETGGIIIRFRDDGPGTDPEAIYSSKKLGMKLVNLLTEQLEGTFGYDNHQGSCFTLSFLKIPVFENKE